MIDSYEETIVLYFGDDLEWSFENLLPGTTYYALIQTFLETQQATSDLVQFKTNPNAPILRDQIVNDIDSTVKISLQFNEKISYFEYIIICNDVEALYGPFSSAQLFEFITETEHFGCHFKARSFFEDVPSNWLEFVIGVSLLEDLSVNLVGKNEFFFFYSVRAGKWSHVHFSYVTETLKVDTSCPAPALSCMVEGKDIPGVYLNFTVTIFLDSFPGLTDFIVAGFPPYLQQSFNPKYKTVDERPTVILSFMFFGQYDEIQVTTEPYVEDFSYIISKQ